MFPAFRLNWADMTLDQSAQSADIILTGERAFREDLGVKQLTGSRFIVQHDR